MKVVSIFSGCGGLDLGFIQAGYEVIYAIDFFKDAVETYRLNIGDHIVYGDIITIHSSQIPDDFDVLLGGFPCQGFSIANSKRSMEDTRNFLYLELLRILKYKKPPHFVFENVKGLLSMQKGRVLQMILSDIQELGYKVDYKVLRASNYGVPQNRDRVIIIGNNIGKENNFPKPLDQPTISVKESIGHLYDVRTRDDSFVLNGKTIHNHIASTNVSDKFWKRRDCDITQGQICDYLKHWKDKSGITVKGIDKHFGYRHTAGHWFRKDKSGSIPNPKDWKELKVLLGFDDKYDSFVTELVEKNIEFEQSLRISNWETPSDTITASGPEIHPSKQRRLSVRECAILQSFPDEFIFVGSLNSMYKQIGNAVPVKLAKCIAENLID